MYLVAKGRVTGYDQVGQLGSFHTNPTIAIPPGGLSSLSFLDSIHADMGAGQVTLPYDPGIPTSCETFEFQHPASGIETLNYGSGFLETISASAGVQLSSDEMFLAPPKQLLTLDPAWKICSGWITDGADRAWCM